MIDTSIINETLKKSTEKQRYFFESSYTGENLSLLGVKYGLSSSLYKTFVVTVGDIILGFYKIEDTVPLLQQELELDAKTAALLGAEVLDFLAPLSDSNWSLPENLYRNEPIYSSNLTNDVGNYPKYESGIETVIPELRTMAADMERSPTRSTFNTVADLDEPTYTSTQPTIERAATEAPSYSAPLYQPPKPNVDAPLEKPRWG